MTKKKKNTKSLLLASHTPISIMEKKKKIYIYIYMYIDIIKFKIERESH